MPPVTASTSACEAADFTGTPGWNAGDIALVQRGTCPYVQKAQLAQAAGAAGLILYNEGNSPDRLDVPSNLPLGAEGIHIPRGGDPPLRSARSSSTCTRPTLRGR